MAKNSASDIGTPSSTFFSELTEGLTRFLLDEGNEPVGHPGAAGKLALRQPESGPDTAQARTDVDAHGV